MTAKWLIIMYLFQIQWVVQRKNSASGFVALDYVEFRLFEGCNFKPDQAKPIPTTIPPTTTKAPTTAPPTTTIEPTEPPDCENLIYDLYKYAIFSGIKTHIKE